MTNVYIYLVSGDFFLNQHEHIILSGPQFGGKISFANTRGATLPKTVNISHVVTEEQFLRKSVDLERSLAEGKYVDFCGEKVEECTDAMEKNMWNFLKVRVM